MVTRRDMGELTFFMSQPAAIAVESLVQWGFSRVRSRTAGPDNNQPALSMHAGYIWVVFWFSVSLPVYVKGCRDAGIIRDAIFGSRPFDAGVRLADWISY